MTTTNDALQPNAAKFAQFFGFLRSGAIEVLNRSGLAGAKEVRLKKATESARSPDQD